MPNVDLPNVRLYEKKTSDYNNKNNNKIAFERSISYITYKEAENNGSSGTGSMPAHFCNGDKAKAGSLTAGCLTNCWFTTFINWQQETWQTACKRGKVKASCNANRLQKGKVIEYVVLASYDLRGKSAWRNHKKNYGKDKQKN